jgi:hypothetical protein
MLTEEEAKKKWCPFARVRNSSLDDECIKTDIEIAPPKGEDYNVVTIAPFAGPAYNRFVVGQETPDEWISPDNSCVASQCMAWRHDVSPSTNQPTGRGFCGLAGISGLPT